MFIYSVSVKRLEQRAWHMTEICMSCTRYRDPDIKCDSIDCDIYFERAHTARQLAVVDTYHEILATLTPATDS